MTARLRLFVTTLLICAVGLFAFACGGDDGPSLLNNDNPNSTANVNNTTPTGGQVGDPCTDQSDCLEGVCRTGFCDAATCSDGTQNGEETDVDCGALGCALCDIGDMCAENTDCVSGICNSGTCVDKNCTDGIQNGLETAVDCGFLCPACEDGLGCLEDTDCVSMVCSSGTCAVPTCEDQRANGNETDVDCGGPDCLPCPDELACEAPSDCVSGVCTGGICAVPTCTDGVLNGQETALDCGGPSCDPCAVGEDCERGLDCTSQVCNPDNNRCAAPTCIDGKTNGNETDRDCGGQQTPSCDRCSSGRECNVGGDCESGVCDAFGLCAVPTCSDNVENGTETAVDCGGRCGPCADGQGCDGGRDCLSAVCSGGICQGSQCSDFTENGQETDTDCGGPTCQGCVSGSSCLLNTDCQSNLCEIQQGNQFGRCAAAQCDDGTRNGLETDVDCGGPDCPACGPGDSCLSAGDCESFVCSGGSQTCQPATCSDGVKNGNETDVDCGGPNCRKCGLGDGCAADGDCTTDICDGGAAGPFCAVCNEGDTRETNQTCGYANRGRREQTCDGGIWVNDACTGVYYRSCKEILAAGQSTGDGRYDIDPDGSAMLYDEFEVFCDMSTSGGGWTEITPCIANQDLFGDLIAIRPAASASVSSCKPVTRDGIGDHTYYYEFTWPSGLAEFYLDGYEVKGNADPARGDTSDFGFIQTNWNQAAANTRGDVSFGVPTRVIDSYSRAGLNTVCNSCTYPWPRGTRKYAVPASTKFRIGWGEAGPQYEGWYPWWNGTIRIR